MIIVPVEGPCGSMKSVHVPATSRVRFERVSVVPQVEVDASPGIPMFNIVGLPIARVYRHMRTICRAS